MANKNLKAAGAHSMAILASLVMVIPIYLIAVNAFKSRAQASAMSMELPTEWHFENFSTVIAQGKLWTSFFNSLLYATASTAITTLVSAMAAYVLSRARTRGRRFLYLFIIMGIALPINYFTLTSVMQFTNLNNTRLGIILLYAATQIPFTVFLIYGFIETIPKELDEAAIVDGCKPLSLFFLIILPLLTPVLATAAILNFLGVWSDFIFPLYYLNSSANWPMTLAVYNFFGQFQQDWNLVSADILLTILPVIVVYLLGQRFILSGLTSGGVKG
ncbi:ABC transporter permease [Devosia sp. Root685]|uniref:carbohydrate ABC transporter permease n=1 Tax=Devosia sp. Root685 TaxID=1736587 RepID=UPI00070160C8|nr:carbohydrate ABC transporter permease [Devosia sp. Root685]KRA99799.1 ABC transporter permease [Devosia sp. Root685]